LEAVMTTYLLNHVRIPNGVPKPEGLPYLERARNDNGGTR